jgi:hypothetical protein
MRTVAMPKKRVRDVRAPTTSAPAVKEEDDPDLKDVLKTSELEELER